MKNDFWLTELSIIASFYQFKKLQNYTNAEFGYLFNEVPYANLGFRQLFPHQGLS